MTKFVIHILKHFKLSFRTITEICTNIKIFKYYVVKSIIKITYRKIDKCSFFVTNPKKIPQKNLKISRRNSVIIGEKHETNRNNKTLG